MQIKSLEIQIHAQNSTNTCCTQVIDETNGAVGVIPLVVA